MCVTMTKKNKCEHGYVERTIWGGGGVVREVLTCHGCGCKTSTVHDITGSIREEFVQEVKNA